MDQLQAAFSALQKQDMQAASINAIKQAVASGRGSICVIADSDMVNGAVSPSSSNYDTIKQSAAAGCKLQDSQGKTVIVR